MELSKGGCQDFVETECYSETGKYSHLDFKQDHQLPGFRSGYAHFFPLTLGIVNEHRHENICD